MIRPSEVLRHVEPFSGLSQSDLTTLEEIGSVVMAAPGEWLCRPGAQPKAALILLEGRVTEQRSDGDVAHHEPGAFIAPGALLSAQVIGHAVRVDEQARLLELDRLAFERLIEAHHPLGRAILQTVTGLLVLRVRSLNQKLNELLHCC